MKRLYLLLSALFLFGLFPITAGAESDNPVLALTQIPALGQEARFEGQIYRKTADIDPASYRVAIYIQLGDGGDAYYKPYDGAVLPPLNGAEAADGYILGTFSLAAYTDGEYAKNDMGAKYVHLLILPASENPTSDNYQEMLGKALETVTVTRTADGVTASPQYEPKPLKSDEPPPDPGWHVAPDKIMLDVGFHSDGSAIGSALSEAHIRKHLQKLSSFANAVRFYDCSDNLRPAYEIAKELGFPYVAATAYLTADDAANKAELDRAAALLNAGLASVCAVGNETLKNGVLSAEKLASYIKYLRGKVTVENAYLTTADTVQELLKAQNKPVRDACDFLFAHDYPYLGGVDPDKQLSALANDYKDLKATDSRPDYKVYIGE
ncbi:MAG: hypothetical protein IJK52_07040, partial [Oscillospiraceae bacterium]|nr:hypothetical protein [Oscillospiraceae bacterium]